MDSIQYIPTDHGFTLLVRPPGWASQKIWLIVTAVAFGLALAFTFAVFHGLIINGRPAAPADSIDATPLWAIGLATLAAAFQGARRRAVFIADTQLFIIATVGPLRKTTREFPLASLRAALVADSTTLINGTPLKQLQLHFADRNTPLTLFTGRDPSDLTRIAQHLTNTLNLAGNSYSPTQYLEIRLAPLHVNTFKIICGIGVAIGLVLFLFSSTIGMPAAGLTFFGTILTALIVTSRIFRKARCPNCHAVIKRDNLSPEGYFQYTCPACRILWQSPIRAGGSDS